MKSDGHYLATVNYIHHNPVKHRYTEKWTDWPWSSARDWMRLPDVMLKVDRTLPATLDIPWTNHRADRSL